MSKALDTLSEIRKIERSQTKLLNMIHASLLIQAVIPGIFRHGSITLKMTGKMLPYPSRDQGIIKAHYLLGNGDIYNISSEQFKLIRSDKTIHPDYT